MTNYLQLIDKHGDDMTILKEAVIAVYEDFVITGEGTSKPIRSVHGSTVLLSGGVALFVREKTAEITEQLKAVI